MTENTTTNNQMTHLRYKAKRGERQRQRHKIRDRETEKDTQTHGVGVEEGPNSPFLDIF